MGNSTGYSEYPLPTLKDEIDRYIDEEGYKVKPIKEFVEYLQENGFREWLAGGTMFDDPLKDAIRTLVNSSSFKPFPFISAAYNQKTKEFHPIITKEFLEKNITVTHGINIYYSDGMQWCFLNKDYPNEEILIKILEMVVLDINMKISDSYRPDDGSGLLRHTCSAKYMNLLKYLLDRNIWLFGEKKKYLLRVSNSLDLHYPEAHQFIIDYYTEKHNEAMLERIKTDLTPRVVTQ